MFKYNALCNTLIESWSKQEYHNELDCSPTQPFFYEDDSMYNATAVKLINVETNDGCKMITIQIYKCSTMCEVELKTTYNKAMKR